MYLVWPAAALCCSPTLWMWKLIVHTPSQISWYYTLQGIEVPESIERNIFSNVIIEGHFQCALPLQCMPEPGIMQDQKIWNYGVHFGLPLVTAVYCKFCQNLSVIRKFCETLQAGTHRVGRCAGTNYQPMGWAGSRMGWAQTHFLKKISPWLGPRGIRLH